MHKVFFFHCPKAGGTSISTALQQAAPPPSVSPLIENDMAEHAGQVTRSGYGDFRGYDIYCGHYGKDVFDAVTDGHLAVTNFRHPVSRIASLYNFFRDQVALTPEQLAEDRFYAVRFAKDNGFRAFVACNDPRVVVYTRNQHVRQLTRSPWENAPGCLQQARRLVARMAWYYICEYSDLSLIWLRNTLGIRTITHENKTKKSSTSINPGGLDVDLVRDICRYNAEDLSLYRFAVARLLSWQPFMCEQLR